MHIPNLKCICPNFEGSLIHVYKEASQCQRGGDGICDGDDGNSVSTSSYSTHEPISSAPSRALLP